MATDTLASALAAFQADVPKIGKGRTADMGGKYAYRFADLADATDAIMPALGKVGLSFSARPMLNEANVFVLRYTLRHASGDEVTGDYPLPSGNTPPQQIGSAITYARRYALLAVTGVAAGDDDDGATAPPASAKPAERHEASWDPADQELLRDAWIAEIGQAANDVQLREIGKSIGAGRRNGELSPATYDRLVQAGAARKAELNSKIGDAP